MVGQLLLLCALWATVGLGPAGWLAGTAFAATLWITLTVAVNRSPGRSLGPADRVTLLRAVLVGTVTALVADGASAGTATGVLVGVAVVALLLDAVDGRVARRTCTVSALGARFDVETDAFLVLVLSVRATGSVGAWVVAIGLLRYVFLLAARIAPWLRTELPVSNVRKLVGALQGCVLVVVASGGLPGAVPTILAGAALLLLGWSFGRDIGWSWRHRAAVG